MLQIAEGREDVHWQWSLPLRSEKSIPSTVAPAADVRYHLPVSERYNPSAVEAKWQKIWQEARSYNSDLTKAKKPYYNLVMFPYPSGDKLHVGHWYNFAPADSHGRYMRMKGFDVFEPMGFDAFGLPAENFAVKTGTPPAESTAKNVQTMIKQLSRIGTMYDWETMVNTSDASYYRWTQWLFLQMHKHGLAYKKEAPVNFCPSCQTVLANEQAQDGTCERCGTPVMQKLLNQWFWNITKYSQKLLDNLDHLDWPEKTKLMQRNWIGRSEGAEVKFQGPNSQFEITVFTTRPDTLFGCTYLVLAPEHPLVDVITAAVNKNEVAAYRKDMAGKNDMQRTELAKTKTGVPTGAFALHPVTGEKIAIWIADYVLMTYGTGAIMAVPGHDERDFEFATKFKLPIAEVVRPLVMVSSDESIKRAPSAFTGEGIVCNSAFLDSLKTPEARKKMIAWLEDNDKGRGMITYRLRDWLISRQRYWGAPIPIVYDPEGKPHPIPEKHLPWLLPTDVAFKPTGESPLRHSKEFKARTEKIFGKGWTPEYDTMDTFVCSSFYFLRYLAAGDESRLVDPHVEKKWMPVSMYIGGPEHACMHLIYARFVMMALKDFGLVSHEEPFKKLVHQGLITNKGAKMSKSKNNVVSPDGFIERHGSDVFRMYLMFMGPFTEGGDWSDTGIKGIDRFVQRVWKTFGTATKATKAAEATKETTTALHATIKKVTESMEKIHFNTGISALMEFLNFIEGKPITADIAQTFAKLLAPLAPHLAEELWEIWAPKSEVQSPKSFVVDQPWPTFDPKLLVSDTMTIAIQVNGKLRGDIVVASDAKKEAIFAAARSQENVKKFLTGVVKKEIYISGKLVSFVV